MSKTKIMIVEDELLTASYIENTLLELAYTVTSIEFDGKKAIEQAQQNKPDLILMDIKLKGDFDGIETADEIRTSLNIPIVYLTAHSDENTLERAKITEPFGFVLKPFEKRDLHSNIEIALYKHKMEAKIKELAHYDSLTGLINRSFFYSWLEKQLAYARRDSTIMALMYLDLDEFKYVNDTHGHDVGDLLLREVADRLRGCVRESDTVARLGGDEFTVITANLSCREDAMKIAGKIISSIGEPYSIKEINCSIGVSIGITYFPNDGADGDVLLKNADTAMYKAKEKGKNIFQLYSEGRGSNGSNR